MILRFLTDVVLESAMKIGIALIVIIVVPIAIEMILASQMVEQFVSVFRTGQGMVFRVNQIAGYLGCLPCPSATFTIGVIMGVFRG
ncbi:MAG: hypothetical protein HYY68_02145 [Thaumarchaeota archaeon]|nr:hypothetical protein [Nitrososphaerota archaeon]